MESTDSKLTLIKRWRCCNGDLLRYSHLSTSTLTPMIFTIFIPGNCYKEGEEGTAPPSKLSLIYYLSGLTCTDENVIQKGFAHLFASKRNVCIVAPDTSPR